MKALCCKGWVMNSVSFSLAAQHLICSTKVTLFALVDGLQYERYFGESLSVQQPAAVPLFDTWPDSRVAFAGLWVMEMNSIMGFRERLCELEAALPSVSWMISSSWEEDNISYSGSGCGSRQGNGGFYYQGKQYDPILNEPMVVSAETHGDFWEDDMDHSETVNYEGIDSKAGIQAKTDEKTCRTAHRKGR